MCRRRPLPAAFQSAPLTEARGDRLGGVGGFVRCSVSIRSPHRSKGRRPKAWVPGRFFLFQSAPLTEARGDALERGVPNRDLVVSIRSPHRSKGRRQRLVADLVPSLVSIRSPHRSKGRRVAKRRMREPCACFNPLPSPKQGETSSTTGRLSDTWSFQSAPLTEARGDY